MPFNPWRLVKGLWDRPKPVSYPTNQDVGVDDTHVQLKTPKPTISLLPFDSGLEAPSTTSLPPSVSGVHLADPFLDDLSKSALADDKESHNIEDDVRSHARRTSDASSTTTLDHDCTAANREDQKIIDSGNEGTIHNERSEEQAGEIDFDRTDELGREGNANNRGFQTRKHNNIDKRRQLVPKSSRDRQLRPASSRPKRDYASEIITEQATETHFLPEGYVGTWRGFQFFSPSLHHNGSCGAEAGLHRLTCGHWVGSSESCGVNCNSPVLENEAFVCHKCNDEVKDVLNHQLSTVEREKLERAKGGYRVFYIALAVEFATKHKVMKGNVTETVMSVLDGYGRTSIPSGGPKEPESVPIEECIREIQRLHERKEFEAKNPLVRHQKRVHNEIDQSEANVDETGPTSRHKHKKHKTRIEKHTSPTSGLTHGSKRKAIDADIDTPRSRTKKFATTEAALLQSSNKSAPGDRKRGRENDDEQAEKDVIKRHCSSHIAYDKKDGGSS